VVEKEKEKEKVVEERPKPKTKKQDEKIIDVSPKPITIEMGSHILPHPGKVRWGGEDAVFVKGRTFGVFDGVSGADKIDGVPLYSRTLANEMKKMVGTEGVTIQDMTTYLTNAAAYADGAATGASTAVVASIGENGFLQALNIGDSYCVVIRDGKVTAKTREISHYWECPYQLSEDSPDRPKDGTKLNVELIPGDIIIMGSDGVFDNVNDDLLLELVTKSPAKATQLAKKICDLSRKQSLDNNSETPYAKQAQRRGDPDFRTGLGGKVDDVSCVVVVCK
jgi:protein phosphatase PTC7